MKCNYRVEYGWVKKLAFLFHFDSFIFFAFFIFRLINNGTCQISTICTTFYRLYRSSSSFAIGGFRKARLHRKEDNQGRRCRQE